MLSKKDKGGARWETFATQLAKSSFSYSRHDSILSRIVLQKKDYVGLSGARYELQKPRFSASDQNRPWEMTSCSIADGLSLGLLVSGPEFSPRGHWSSE